MAAQVQRCDDFAGIYNMDPTIWAMNRAADRPVVVYSLGCSWARWAAKHDGSTAQSAADGSAFPFLFFLSQHLYTATAAS